MLTYTTLEGQVLDLSGLTDEERAFLDRCVVAYRGGLSWITLSNMVTGAENPLVLATGGWVTQAVMDHPLYQAVSDLEDRVGIAQGRIDPDPNDDVDRDPYRARGECGGRGGWSSGALGSLAEPRA